MKKIITELTKDSVNITIVADGIEHLVSLPCNLVSPQLSLQIAGMLSSDPQLPRIVNDEK